MMLENLSCRVPALAMFLITMYLSSTEAFTAKGLMYPGRSDFFELSVIHINDFHARFVQTSSRSGTCYDEEKCVGGIARLYTASHQLVNERPNAIFLNAGDHFQGTLWYNVHRWNITATFMNMLPHDAMTIGNHEFDHGIAGLVPFLDMVTAPVVVTNIDDSEEPDIQRKYTNSTIIKRNGTLIGVIGVIHSRTNTLASTEKLKFLDEVETVNLEAGKLKAQGVDIIIALSHCGLQVDLVMAAECPDLDLIVGGHSHSFLYSGEATSSETARNKYPVVVVQKGTERTVLIVQAYAYSKYMGNLSVWFDEAGEVQDWDGNPILMDYSIEQNAEVLAALVPWKVEVDALGSKVVGSTRVDLTNTCRYRECNIGNLITDAMIDAYVDKAENSSYWTYAAIACTHVGGVRGSIESTYFNITYSDLVMVLPFGNTWDVIELQGTYLLETLEYAVTCSYSDTSFRGMDGYLLLWSGLQVTYNLTNDPYSRVTSAKVRCRMCETPVYEDIDPDEWYRIATNSFLMSGGNEHAVILEHHRNHEIGTLDIDHFVNYVGKISPIIQGREGRVTFEGTWNG